MSYFPEDIPFMSEEERKANGIKTAKEIETLKMQLSKKDATFDSVRRQQVIDRIEWWFKILKQNSDILIDAIKTLPPTHLESHWIPCSERLPENNCQCIATAKVKHVDGYPDYEVDTADYTDGIFTTANS